MKEELTAVYLATSHEGRADCCVSSYESWKERAEPAVYLATSHDEERVMKEDLLCI